LTFLCSNSNLVGIVPGFKVKLACVTVVGVRALRQITNRNPIESHGLKISAAETQDRSLKVADYNATLHVHITHLIAAQLFPQLPWCSPDPRSDCRKKSTSNSHLSRGLTSRLFGILVPLFIRVLSLLRLNSDLIVLQPVSVECPSVVEFTTIKL